MNARDNQIRKRRKNVNKFRIIVSAVTIFACVTLLFTIFKQQIQIRNINNVKLEQQTKKDELEKEIKKIIWRFQKLRQSWVDRKICQRKIRYGKT